MKKIFVTGIGTEVGKTVISAIVTEALKADYWKPVQAGDLDNTDTMKVQALVSNPNTKFHSEAYRLKTPMSPHAAAEIDGVEIKLTDIHLPETSNQTLVIEGAGGLMVPLNDKDMMVDLIGHIGAETILVSQNYLGSINHTLMSVELLKQCGLPIMGIIFNGPENKSTEDVILQYSGLKCLGKIRQQEFLTKDKILNLAQELELE